MKENTRTRDRQHNQTMGVTCGFKSSRRLTRNGALRKEQGKGKECYDKTESKPVGLKNCSAPRTYTTSNSLPPPSSLLTNNGSPRFSRTFLHCSPTATAQQATTKAYSPPTHPHHEYVQECRVHLGQEHLARDACKHCVLRRKLAWRG